MSTVAALSSQLESIWENLDEVLSGLDRSDWDRAHGPHWTFRDIPFHLSYFDEEIIAGPLEFGAEVPEDQQAVFATIAELNAWNDSRLANRPTDKTPDELMFDMLASRQRIRDEITRRSEDSLSDPVLLRLPGAGWSDAEAAIRLAQVHVWNHFVEAKLRLGRPGPDPDPAVTHTALQSLVSSMPILFNQAAATGPFVSQVSIGGSGGGDWAISIADGDCIVEPIAAGEPDLTMRYRDPESFAAAAFKVTHPMRLMLRGRLKVKGMSKMGKFAKLFPAPPTS